MKSNLDKPAQIAILGGGLVGRLLAWRLARDASLISNNIIASINESTSEDTIESNAEIDNGITNTITPTRHRITVFEKGTITPSTNPKDKKAAAFTAAAMISPLSELVASELDIFQLGQKSLTLWPKWLHQLGCPQHFHQHGSLVVAHTNDFSELEQFKQELHFKLNQQPHLALSIGLDSESESSNDSQQSLQWLTDRASLNALEPAISQHFQSGLFLPSEAHIDHNEVLFQLVTQARNLGVEFKENSPTQPDDEALKDFDLIFDCRGMGFKESARLEDGFRGVRGEVIRIECKEVHLKRPIRIMHPRYKLYIVPKPNNQFTIGATEIESEDRSAISLRSSMELLSALYAVNPAFAEARIISQETNLRPAFMNNLPRIESLQSKYSNPIIRINGLYRHGYLIGPAIIEQALRKAAL